MTDRHSTQRGMLFSGRFPELEGALVARVRELRAGRPLAPLTIVVGSAAVRRRVQDVLVQGLGAVANVSVVTLSRLATDITTRAAGGRPPHLLIGQARERVVRRLVNAAAAAGDLRYFGPVGALPHFPQALAATFDDLRQASIEPTSGWAAGDVPGKGEDLEALYSAYCAQLARLGVADDAELHSAAAAADEGEASDSAGTIVYGVYDLNEAQEALVAALLGRGADLFVPRPAGGSCEQAPACVLASGMGLAENRLEPPPADTDLARMAADIVHWRGPSGDALALEGDGSLAVVSAPDERSEVREAAREVLAAALADNAAAFHQCAVVVPHAADTERFAAGLERAGIGVACRRPDRSPGPRVLRRLLDCLAPAAGKPFARRAVLDLFTVAAPGGAYRAAAFAGSALWADEARQAGVVCGLDQWLERTGRRRRGLEYRVAELAASAEHSGADDDGRQRLDDLRRRLDAAQSLEAAVVALHRGCALLPHQASWGVWAGALAGLAESAFDRDTAAAVADAAARLRSLDVLDEEVDVVEMAAVLGEQLSTAGAPWGQAGRDGVAVLTPLELRGLRFRTIIFTGLAEGGFPSRGRPEPIFGDADRRRLAQRRGRRLPLAEARDEESLLLFALACEAAAERLVMMAPRSEAATGRPRSPSRLLLRLASAAAGRPVGLDEFLSGEPLRAVWRRASGRTGRAAGLGVWVDAVERDTANLLSLAGVGRAGTGDYLAAVLADTSAAQRRLAGWGAGLDATPGPYDGLLGEQARSVLSGRDPFGAEMYPTWLERYLACPFTFLLRDVIGLFAPEEPEEGIEISGLEFGILAHEILQKAYTLVIADHLDLDGALEALVAAHRSCCDEAERRGVTGDALSWEARRAALLEDLMMSVSRDPVFEHGGGRPAQVEWRFGEKAGSPVTLELADGRGMRFAGRLDRVDRTAAGGARIIDYKTGKGETEEQRIKDGLSIQLPVYSLAVRLAGGIVEEGSADVDCAYRMVTRRGAFRNVPLAASPEETDERLRTLVGEIVRLCEEGVFARSPHIRCDWCDVRYACGLSAWSTARKRRHESLAPLVALQSRPGKDEQAQASDETGGQGGG
jgi:RecB family exonuclease